MSQSNSTSWLAERSHTWRRASWPTALLFAVPITVFFLGLVTYWFAIADRYRVFLYDHDMGPLVPDTSPFSAVTASRYWMSALVGAGAIMVLYLAVNWLGGRITHGYRPPAWWQVWVLCAVPLLIAIPLITMNVNRPVLPLSNAVQVTLAALAGLALALAPGRMAALRPLDLLLLTPDGLALMLLLTAALGLERMGQWLDSGRSYYIAFTILSMAAGLFLLFLLTALRLWRRLPMPDWSELIVSGLCVAYLLLPLLHHAGFTDGYYYISDADNFFTRDVGLQMTIWFTAGLLVAGISYLRARLQARQIENKPESVTATTVRPRGSGKHR
jgi:hypothetical protein